MIHSSKQDFLATLSLTFLLIGCPLQTECLIIRWVELQSRLVSCNIGTLLLYRLRPNVLFSGVSTRCCRYNLNDTFEVLTARRSHRVWLQTDLG